MTDSHSVLIGMVVDRSGSMSACRDEMQDGLEKFFEKQRGIEGKDVKATLAQFDTEYELVYPPTPIKDVPTYRLVPRGSTALLDAMGRFITEVGADLAKMKESRRPSKVLIVVVTDGMENASREWTREGAVRELVQQQQRDYNWEFVFLGANMDAVREARNFGIHARSAMTFDTANSGVTMDNLARNVVSYAAAAGPSSYNWSDDDRKSAMQ
jgi:uncharacterized protein YegL